LLQHRWKESAIQSDGNEKVRVERMLPIVIGQRQGTPARRSRTAYVLDQNVEAAETIRDRLDDLIDPCAPTDVCLDEPIERAAGGQDRAVVITFPQPRMRRSTMASPMPLVPPVTRIRLPLKSAASGFCDSFCISTSVPGGLLQSFLAAHLRAPG
jgi:hypothetical protein